MMSKLFVSVLVFLALILGVQAQFFGGEARTVYEYDLNDYCLDVYVNVSSSSQIEFTPDNIREYDLLNCVHQEAPDEFNDFWLCSCSNGSFDLVLSTLPNTVNSYEFVLFFVFDELMGGVGSVNDSFSFARSSGGYCGTQWSCSEWGECVNGFQFRECSFPENFCEPEFPRPEEFRECVVVEQVDDVALVEDDVPLEVLAEEDEVVRVAPLAGAVVGPGGSVSWLWLAAFLLLVLVLLSVHVVVRYSRS